jgi:hypothetical protein
VPATNGTTDFSVLQNELKGNATKIVMVALDLLYLNGYDLSEAAAHSFPVTVLILANAPLRCRFDRRPGWSWNGVV